MKKSLGIVILVVLALILVVIGCFFYNKWLESKMGLVSFNNVSEQEINGVKYIENKEVGLRFVIPQGWEIKKDSAGISMHSPDFIPFSEDSFFIPKKGCWIETFSERLKSNTDYDWEYGDLKLMISNQNYLSQNNNDDKRKLKVVEISGLKGINSNLLEDSNPNNTGNFIYTAVPKDNLLYIFGTYIFGEQKETCFREFNNFLDTINIKK